jgi:hypothetical protein
MKVILIVLGLCLFCFLGMVLYLYLHQGKMLYFPQPLDRSWGHVKEHTPFEYQFEGDGVKLHGWLINPERKKLLIYYGGNGEEASQLIGLFEELSDVAVLLVNYRGYGESEGDPTEKGLVGDALGIFDDVKDRFDSIVLLGRSLGSGIAVQVAAQRNIDQLILVTPYDSIANVGQGMYPWAPVGLLLKDPFDSLAASEEMTHSALFLIAESDRIIPHKHSQNLYDNWKGPKDWVVVQGSDHNSIIEFPMYWNSLKQYIDESAPSENL